MHELKLVGGETLAIKLNYDFQYGFLDPNDRGGHSILATLGNLDGAPAANQMNNNKDLDRMEKFGIDFQNEIRRGYLNLAGKTTVISRNPEANQNSLSSV